MEPPGDWVPGPAEGSAADTDGSEHVVLFSDSARDWRYCLASFESADTSFSTLETEIMRHEPRFQELLQAIHYHPLLQEIGKYVKRSSALASQYQ